MRRLFLATPICVLALAIPAGAQPKPPEGAEGGKVIYQTLCASCHGMNAQGGGPVAESLRTPPPDLTRIAERNDGAFSGDDVASRIDGRQEVAAHGTSEMPVWGDGLAWQVSDAAVREERIARSVDLLVQYLKSIQR